MLASRPFKARHVFVFIHHQRDGLRPRLRWRREELINCGLTGSDTAAMPVTNHLILRGMICLLLGSGLSLVVLGLLAWRAPRGWQNQDGFHLGDEPNHPNA